MAGWGDSNVLYRESSGNNRMNKWTYSTTNRSFGAFNMYIAYLRQRSFGSNLIGTLHPLEKATFPAQASHRLTMSDNVTVIDNYRHCLMFNVVISSPWLHFPVFTAGPLQVRRGRAPRGAAAGGRLGLRPPALRRHQRPAPGRHW